MELIVPDDKLSLAIGKKGQNVRLASQLTGWRIDIHSESKIYELERRAKEQIAHAIAAEGFDRSVAETLFKLGWRSVGELARAHVEELAGLPGVGGPDGAHKVIDGAKAYVAGGGRRSDDVAQGGRAPRRACRATSSCSSSTASTRTCSASSTRRTSTRPRTSSRRRSIRSRPRPASTWAISRGSASARSAGSSEVSS